MKSFQVENFEFLNFQLTIIWNGSESVGHCSEVSFSTYQVVIRYLNFEDSFEFARFLWNFRSFSGFFSISAFAPIFPMTDSNENPPLWDLDIHKRTPQANIRAHFKRDAIAHSLHPHPHFVVESFSLNVSQCTRSINRLESKSAQYSSCTMAPLVFHIITACVYCTAHMNYLNAD